MICTNCGSTFKAKRADARLCSARCRKAASRCGGGAQNGRVTDNPADGALLPVPASPAPAPPTTASAGDVIELGRLAGDTVADRRWRVLVEAGGHTLQCEAMTPGGWLSVTREPTMQGLRRFAVWCGLTIEAEIEIAPPALQLAA
jgi:hypothetical protein